MPPQAVVAIVFISENLKCLSLTQPEQTCRFSGDLIAQGIRGEKDARPASRKRLRGARVKAASANPDLRIRFACAEQPLYCEYFEHLLVKSQRNQIPPVETGFVEHLAHTESDDFPKMPQIAFWLAESRKADDRASRLAAPVCIGGSGRIAEINDKVPIAPRASRNTIFAIKEKNPFRVRGHFSTRSQLRGVPFSMSRTARFPTTSGRWRVCRPCAGRMERTFSSLKD